MRTKAEPRTTNIIMGITSHGKSQPRSIVQKNEYVTFTMPPVTHSIKQASPMSPGKKIACVKTTRIHCGPKTKTIQQHEDETDDENGRICEPAVNESPVKPNV